MRKVSFHILFLILSLISHGQELEFYKENITMKLDSGYFLVNGTYYLRSDSHQSSVLLYPYPVDSIYGSVDSVRIYNLTENKIIDPLRSSADKTLFPIDFNRASDLAIQVSYRQKLYADKAEYILKSTIGWKKPLEQAGYQLIVPRTIRIRSFSMPPQDSIVTSDEKVYLWNKQDFMPMENLVFRFVSGEW